jgi:8-oxo-dGTP pyrophosphatase MutT (NUDIX family)
MVYQSTNAWVKPPNMYSCLVPKQINSNFNEYTDVEVNIQTLQSNLHIIKKINDLKDNTIEKVTECGIILLNSNQSKVLLVFQNESKSWGLPKGKMDSDELAEKDYMRCAKRELEEETRINLNMNKTRKLGSVIILNKLFYILTLTKEPKDTMRYIPEDTVEIGAVKWLNIIDIKRFIHQNKCNITIKKFIRYMLPMKRSYDSLYIS